MKGPVTGFETFHVLPDNTPRWRKIFIRNSGTSAQVQYLGEPSDRAADGPRLLQGQLRPLHPALHHLHRPPRITQLGHLLQVTQPTLDTGFQ